MSVRVFNTKAFSPDEVLMRYGFTFLLLMLATPLFSMEKPYDVTQDEDVENVTLEKEGGKSLFDLQKENWDRFIYQYNWCPYCLNFCKTEDLIIHMKSRHGKIFLFNCHLCSKRLRYPKCFDNHLTTHAGYVCFYKGCEKVFLGKNNWMEHLDKEH
jgi:hypothetical protein